MPWVAQENASFPVRSANANKNAMMIAGLLSGKGWSPLSAAAVLGNIQHEGLMNPWYWEGGLVTPEATPTVAEAEAWPDAEKQTMHGYGFFQYTPYDKYVNSANSSLSGYAPHFRDVQGNASDGKAQILFMLSDMMTSNWGDGQYNYYRQEFLDVNNKDISVFVNQTQEDFIAGNAVGADDYEKIENLTGTFELQYEAPGAQAAANTYYLRVYDAQYYYDLIKDAFPWAGSSSFKIYMYLKPNWKRRRFA